MKREHLSATESVAQLFKVTPARTKRRLVRRKDSVDWEFMYEILRAAYRPELEPWPSEPLAALMLIALSHVAGDARANWNDNIHTWLDGNWERIMDPLVTEEQLGLGVAEAGHLRTILHLVLIRFGDLNLGSLQEMKTDRALQELSSFPGIDLPSACTLLLRSFGHQILPPTVEVGRILTRMGVLPLGLSEAESLERLEQIPTGIPINDLLSGLTALAKNTCFETEPICSACPVVKLCAQGRESIMAEPAATAMTVVDLFAGAGGMSLGLSQAGFRPVLAVELDTWACETYRVNHLEVPRNHVLAGDIRKISPTQGLSLLGEVRPDVVVGGPPCQGFSLIGKRGRSTTRFIDDPRNKLYKEYARWIAHLRPRFVIMENVPGLYSLDGGSYRRAIEENLRSIGYAVDDLVLDTSRFGIAQRRQRVIFIGASLEDFGDQAAELVVRVTQLLREHSDPEVTLYEAISDLPPLEAGTGTEASPVPHRSSGSAYAEEMGAGLSRLVFHHVARPINLRDKFLYARLKPGETASDAIDQGARHLMVYRNDVFQDKYRRLRYDEPAPTIMSHLAKDGHMFIHPDARQHRSISVREAARIQSFPDDFLFLGPRTAQFTQVGNAVPPKLARAIGQALMRSIQEVIK